MHSSFIIDPSNEPNQHLVLELSDDTASFCWTAGKTLTGLRTWKYEKIKDLSSILEHLPARPGKIFVSLNTRDFVLLPVDITISAPATLENISGKGDGVVYERDINGERGRIAFRVPLELENLLRQHFDEVHFSHSLVCNLPKDQEIAVVFYEKNFSLRMNYNGLKLLNIYRYDSPAEVVYILMQACNVYGVNPEKCSLLLSGMIDENSKLYNELYRFFLNISFSGTGKNNYSEAFSNYPAHYFDHFHSLAGCAS